MILRYCPDPVLVPSCFRTQADTAGGTKKDTHKVPRQDSHPFQLTKSGVPMSIPCQEDLDVEIQVIALFTPGHCRGELQVPAAGTTLWTFPVPTHHTAVLGCLVIAGHGLTRRSEMYIVPPVHE